MQMTTQILHPSQPEAGSRPPTYQMEGICLDLFDPIYLLYSISQGTFIGPRPYCVAMLCPQSRLSEGS
jgi:hypothetical protein